MKNKKAFTLVELLAVIVILAVILVIAVPQVLDVIDTTKVGSLESSAKLIANSAEKKYAEYLALGKDTSTIKCSDVSKLNNKDYGTCTVSFDENGKATVLIKGKDDGKFDGLKCEGTKDNMVCGDIPPLPVINCTFDGELAQGAEYVNGQYTYRYKQEYDYYTWENIEIDGWGVILTDKASTEPITSEVCTYINDKPVVSMSFMFYASAATTLDLSSFNTSKVTNMQGMFSWSAATNLDLSSFNTGNVTNMTSMFARSAATSLDLSNFDTSKVTDMSDMFFEYTGTNIDLSNFDTSNVTDMSSMFFAYTGTNIDLSNFDTSKVTNMSGMFSNSKATNLDLSSFDTSNVTDMSFMFAQSSTRYIDLSSFNTSNVINVDSMFCDAACVDTLDISHFDLNNAVDKEYILACNYS